MKTAFLIVLFLHALIHFLGFLKAFNLINLSQLSLDISKPLGLLWLIAGILFLHALLLYKLEKEWWPFFAVAAVVLSQTLIIISWHEAKFGSVLNLLILLAAIPALGDFHFQNMLKKERSHFFADLTPPSEEIITEQQIAHLPEIVQKWMKRSGVLGNKEISYAHLQQKGKMKAKPNGKWMSFKANQVVNLQSPAFLWSTRVKAAPLIDLVGRDKFKNGEGEMVIKLLSLYKVVDEGHQEKINSGSMLRFLGEICWFPSAALYDYIEWEAQGENSAKATLTINEYLVSGVFTFSEEGDLKSFEALRYYGGGEESSQEVWLIKAIEYKTFAGFRIPSKSKVIWKLPEGDFTWLNLEIVQIDYNRSIL